MGEYSFYEFSQWFLANEDLSKEERVYYSRYLINRTYDEIGGFKLKNLNIYHLKIFFIKIKKSRSKESSRFLSLNTLRNYHYTINKIFNKAVEMEIIEENPAKAIDFGKNIDFVKIHGPNKKLLTWEMDEPKIGPSLSSPQKEDISEFEPETLYQSD